MYSNPADLIGKICNNSIRLFDNRHRKYVYKVRPVLIIGTEKDVLPCDLTVFPISKVSRKHNLHEKFDYPLTKKDHGLTNLNFDPSYVRIHKITTINSSELRYTLNCNFSDLYAGDYQNIKELYEDFAESLF